MQVLDLHHGGGKARLHQSIAPVVHIYQVLQCGRPAAVGRALQHGQDLRVHRWEAGQGRCRVVQVIRRSGGLIVAAGGAGYQAPRR